MESSTNTTKPVRYFVTKGGKYLSYNWDKPVWVNNHMAAYCWASRDEAYQHARRFITECSEAEVVVK